MALVALLALSAGAPFARVAGPTPAQAATCPWMDRSSSPDRRAHQLVGAMTIDQKLAMLSQAQPIFAHYGAAGYVPGQPSLCIPDLVLADAGQGVGDLEVNTTAFPAPISQSASWDPALQRRFGSALGWEAWQKGVNVQLAPGIEIDRVPVNGRNFEYMSEDPYLAGRAAAAEVQGIQANPVIAAVKHYVANSQETNRVTVSSDVDRRTLHEIYTMPYEAAVKEGRAGSVMCSYNLVNGIYACENPDTLTRILKHDLGFDGFVMSDGGAAHSTVAAANAGLDMELNLAPGQYFAAPLKAAVETRQVPMSRLNDMVLRIVRAMFRLRIFEHPAAAEPGAYAADVRRPADVGLARTISEDGTVLLKNGRRILPLGGHAQKVAVIGPGAGRSGAEQFYNGGGSGHVPLAGAVPGVVSPLQGVTQRAQAQGDTVLYAAGSSQAEAVAAASSADLAIVFVGTQDTEGTDRSTLGLGSAGCPPAGCSTLGLPSGGCTLAGCDARPIDQDALISAVAAANPNTIVVLNTGGPVLMPWLSHVKGLLEAWYPGQEDGNAIAAILFGDVNPSAKLPETFPASQTDIPTRARREYPGVNDSQGTPHAAYSEGLLVGYRWYDASGIEPLFPFGFGLSYTAFGYRNLRVRAAKGGAALLSASVEVTNTGRRPGADVPELYIAGPPSTGEPPRQLKGFAKVRLDPGQTRRVSFAIGRRGLAYWNTATGGWRVAGGCYGVLVGHSSRNLVLQARIAVGRARCPGAVLELATGAVRAL